jgi:O-antigen/teichoic acid export membrane protein
MVLKPHHAEKQMSADSQRHAVVSAAATELAQESMVDLAASEPRQQSSTAIDSGVGGFRRLMAASAWLLSAKSATLALGLLQVIVVARVLGPRAYGLLALLTTYTSTVNQLLDSRAWETATTYLVRYRAEGNHAKAAALIKLCYLIDAATALAALLLVALTSGWASQWLLRDAAFAGLLVLFAVTMVANVPTGTSMVLLRVAGRFRSVAFQNAVTAAIRFTAVVIALATTATIASVVWAYVGAACVSGSVMLWMGRRGARSLGLGGLWPIFRAPIGILRRDFRGIARFLLVTNANGTLKLVHRFGDVLLVGYVLGPAPAGFVRLARSFSDLLNVPVVSMYETSYPAFASLWRTGRRKELNALVRRVTTSAGLAAIVGLSVLAVAAAPLVRWTVGPQYEPAVVPLRLFAIGMALAATTSLWHPLLLAVDRPGRSFIALLAGVTVQLAILAFGLVPLGLSAAGFAYIACHIVWALIVGRTLVQLLHHG